MPHSRSGTPCSPQNNPGSPVLIKGDRSVVYEDVVRAMVVLQQAGAPSVGLVTENP